VVEKQVEIAEGVTKKVKKKLLLLVYREKFRLRLMMQVGVVRRSWIEESSIEESSIR
jgi:hypothetical protein